MLKLTYRLGLEVAMAMGRSWFNNWVMFLDNGAFLVGDEHDVWLWGSCGAFSVLKP